MMWEADESHDLWDDEPRNRINRATAGDATDRFVTGNLTSEDLDVERSLRPPAPGRLLRSGAYQG